MAYTSSPETQTYSTQRIQLIHSLDLLPGNTTFNLPFAGTVNVLSFKGTSGEASDIYGETRARINATTVVSAAGPWVCRGMHVWEKSAGTVYYFVVADQNVYTATSPTGPWTVVNSLLTVASSPVRFCEYIDDTGIKKLIMVDGIEGYVFTTNAAGTKITDTDFPSPHVPFPVFLDGYLFLAKANTGDIYNSDLNNPANWTAGSFISSEVYPDDIQALVKINNYILAIGNTGSEYFQDVGNATASPLARYEGAILPFGTQFPNSIASNKDTVMFLANTSDGETSFRIIEGLKFKEVQAAPILRAINEQLTNSGGIVTASTFRGMFCRQNGDLFYVFQLYGTGTSSWAYNTLIFSTKTQYWHKVAFGDATNAWPVLFTAPGTSGNMDTYVAGHWSGIVFFGVTTTSASASPNDTLNGSTFTPIRQQMYVPPNDFGTYNQKYMSRLMVYYLKASDTTSTISVCYSDNGNSSFTTPRFLLGTANGNLMIDGGVGFPFITQLGRFRKRGFLIQAMAGQARYIYIEVDINKGQQ